MFRTVPLSIARSFHCTHSNGVCHTGYSYSLRAGSGRNQFRPDPEKLVHLVGLIIRIHHDARSPECHLDIVAKFHDTDRMSKSTVNNEYDLVCEIVLCCLFFYEERQLRL